MPTLLALDTSTDACSVALLSADGVHQQAILKPREHTQQLLPLVEELLSSHGVSLKQLDAIAFGCGPGSFTGLRICTSVVQGLAYAIDCPVIPVSTLKAMAQAAVREHIVQSTDTIVPALDARMEEVYWAAFKQQTPAGSLVTVAEEQVASPADIDFSCFPTASLCALGSGWHYNELQKVQPQICHTIYYPQAYDIAELGLIEFNASNVTSPLMATPMYLRNEVKWRKRKRIRTENMDIA